MEKIELYSHQEAAIEQMKNGCILCGDVGSGKSRTSLAYFFKYVNFGNLSNGKMKFDIPLYIITTARKRDSKEWVWEADIFGLHPTIDSWNNIGKYTNILDSFFIFDEQRLVGNGAWVRSFYLITKRNKWILLSATPGDTWIDYIPVFIANGFYKNRTEFLNRHAVYSRYTKWPKIDRYMETNRLEKLREKILVNMPDNRTVKRNYISVTVDYDPFLLKRITRDRWNIFKDYPIESSSEYFMLMRKIVNSDKSRLLAICDIMERHDRIIIFYNFDYELELLRTLKDMLTCDFAEWNGHKHEPIPKSDRWLYFAQYTSSAEGWNCIATNAVIFYSQHYSYRVMHQAAGRIDRMNTPYDELYYYTLKSKAWIDVAIARTLANKKTFSESRYKFIS